MIKRRTIFLFVATAVLALATGTTSEATATFVKHLKTSRDFTLKVAEAMPASDYDFKLTPAQMSFGGQMTHLAQGLSYFMSPFSGQKPNPGEPKSKSKEDVISYMKVSFDKAIDEASKLTPEQLAKTYDSEEGKSTGIELLMGALDHTTHHRASAEMYLRAKGITPPQYEY